MIIGLTGGIGSGKSTVAKLIADMTDAKLILTDDVAKDLMQPDMPSYNNVVEKFGDIILNTDRAINRAKLAEIVFNNREKLELLNSCTHPEVIKEVNRIISESAKKNASNIVIESALLLEADLDTKCDEIWFVWTDEDIRKERLKIYRGYSDDKIKSIFESQKKYSLEDVRKQFDVIIYNNKGEEELYKTIKAVLDKKYKM